MKSILLTLLASLLPFFGAFSAEPAPSKVRVLFIGNSFTIANNLPGIIAAMAAGSGKELDFFPSLIGGARLERHWQEGKALAKIQEGNWDYVVLQEESHTPLKDKASMLTNGALFDAEIHKTKARTLLFMTWIRENSRANYPQHAAAYAELSSHLKARIVPVGTAWETALSSGHPPDLYNADKHHPSPAGSYLAACVFYRVLYGVPSTGLPNRIEWKGKLLADLPKELAAELQKIADATPLPEVK